jgi:hypothetical protein
VCGIVEQAPWLGAEDLEDEYDEAVCFMQPCQCIEGAGTTLLYKSSSIREKGEKTKEGKKRKKENRGLGVGGNTQNIQRRLSAEESQEEEISLSGNEAENPGWGVDWELDGEFVDQQGPDGVREDVERFFSHIA